MLVADSTADLSELYRAVQNLTLVLLLLLSFVVIFQCLYVLVFYGTLEICF